MQSSPLKDKKDGTVGPVIFLLVLAGILGFFLWRAFVEHWGWDFSIPVLLALFLIPVSLLLVFIWKEFQSRRSERLTEDEVSAASRGVVLAMRDWHCADQNEITIFVFSVTAKDWRVIVGIAEDWMKERFACALYGDALAARPADLHCVRRNAIEVCERALDGLAVDISPVHERYFQFES